MRKVVQQFQAVIPWLRSLVRLRSMRDLGADGAGPSALAVIGEGPGREALQQAFRDAGWELAVANSFASAIARQEREPFPIILYERELTERGWRQVVAIFSRMSPRPCVILLSQSSDKNLWDELVRHGGFDLLRTPVDRAAVIRTVRAGWSIWRNQHNSWRPAAVSRR